MCGDTKKTIWQKIALCHCSMWAPYAFRAEKKNFHIRIANTPATHPKYPQENRSPPALLLSSLVEFGDNKCGENKLIWKFIALQTANLQHKQKAPQFRVFT